MNGKSFSDPEKMTYKQRIDLGKIVSEQCSVCDARTHERIMKIMNPDCVCVFSKKEVVYVEKVVDKIRYWINAEKNLIQSEPDKIQNRAGIKKFTERVQELGVVYTFCSMFGKSPKQILGWDYSDVFGMLFVDKEQSEYQKRYNKIVESESRIKSKRR